MLKKISVVINTYNAEMFLSQCLDAVKDFDEIVVCDMESTDRTIEIAQEYGCKIVTFPKGNHKSAEPARTFAIQSATSEWVLVVDADEIIQPQMRQQLYDTIEQPDCAAGYYIARQNIFMGMYVRDFSYDYQLRFFIRKGTEWPPYVHTFPIIHGCVKRLHPCNKECVMLHLMDETMHQNIAKLNEYTDNEVEKKANKNYGMAALFWRPAWRMFRSYFLGGGFRMGRRGIIRAMLAGMYQYVLVAKILERKLRSNEQQ